MTRNKTFKRRVRDRMEKTGESYTAARRQLLAREPGAARSASGAADGSAANAPGLAGIHSATTAFRILANHAGFEPSEAALLAAGGGVGIGVFAFQYPEFSSFFLAGRHLWHDDLAFLQGLAGRLDVRLEVTETAGAKKAESNLRDALDHGPVIAFVDLGTLGHRGAVEAYYVVVVLGIDDEAGTARIADLVEAPLEIPLETLARGRARHRKFKNRLVRIADTPGSFDLAAASKEGLRACVGGLEDPPMRGSNFRLDGLDALAQRMRGTGKDSWAEVFPPGPRLWSALGSFYEYVEHYGTGGGLMRPFFADALREAGGRLDLDATPAADAYDALGQAWSTAARAALPEYVPEFAALREAVDDTYAAYDAQGAEARHELEAAAARRKALHDSVFPLAAKDVRAHLERTSDHVDAIARLERGAFDRLKALAT